MSVYLKPGQLKIKDENGDYNGINVVALESTDEYLTEIETKGTQIKAQIEAKGAATKASIPEDYTALSDEVSELNERLFKNDEEAPFIVFNSSMLEKGYYDNSGVKQNHSTRWRTKDMFPMHAGDILFTVPFTVDNKIPVIKIEVYDTQKAHVSTTGWSSSFETYYFGYKFNQDGYYTFSVQVGSYSSIASDYDNKISFTRMFINRNESVRYSEISKVYEYEPIDDCLLERGYWSYSSGNIIKTPTPTRVSSIVPIPVKKGDKILPANKNILFDASNGGTFRGYLNIPYIVSGDGNLYFNFKTSDNSNISPADYSNALIIKRAVDHGITETIRSDQLVNAYHDGTTHELLPANHRISSFYGIHCKKGDHVRVNLDDIACTFYEYSDSGVYITQSSVYYSKSTIVYGTIHIGDYIVQNDSWVNVQFYKISDSSASINPANYDGAYSVIHMADYNTKLSIGKYRFPLSPKKPRIIDQSEYPEMQDGTVINGKLWITMDDYNGNRWFSIVNIQTGAEEKTIPHTLGHANSIDYNANNDTLLVSSSANNGVYLLLHPDTSVESIAPEDCTLITFNTSDCYVSSACWGEDNQTIYNMIGYYQPQDTTLNLCYKIILTMSNGEYTGAYTVQTTYNMDIKVGVDTVFGGNEVNYTQGATYDGYIYVGYGTRRMNYLVLDLDDKTGIANVVGNLYYPLFTEARTNQIMEPELIALNGSKIILGSREWNDKRSFLAEFDR